MFVPLRQRYQVSSNGIKSNHSCQELRYYSLVSCHYYGGAGSSSQHDSNLCISSNHAGFHNHWLCTRRHFCWILILRDPRADQKGSGRYPGRSCITNARSIPVTLGFLYSGPGILIQRGKLDPLRRSCKVSDPFIHLRRPFTISSPLHIRGY